MIENIDDLIAFLKHYHRGRMAHPGLDPASIPADLPTPLALLFRAFGKLIDYETHPDPHDRPPFATQDALLPLARIKRFDGLIEFACECQDNWTCRCASGPGDPPVLSNACDLWNSPAQGFVEVCSTLSHFLTTFCLKEAIFSAARPAFVTSDRSPRDVIRGELEPLWLNARLVDEVPWFHFFASRDGDVLLMDAGRLGGRGTCWVASPTLPLEELLVDPNAATFHSA